MKKILSLLALMVLSIGTTWAATVDDLIPLTNSYVMVCDQLEARPGKGVLFGDNHFLDVTGGSTATNKGQVDLSVVDALGEDGSPLYVTQDIVDKYGADYAGPHYNWLRLKSAQDVIALKMIAGTKITMFLNGNGKTGKDARFPKISKKSDLSDALNDAPTADHPTTGSGYRWEYNVAEDGLYYIGSYNGDMFISFIIVEVPKTFYLKPGVWNADGARYAAYTYINNTQSWFDFAPAEEEGIFSVTIPDSYTGMNLVRMNGTNTENNWDNKWNQTDDIDFTGIKDNTLFTITDWGSGNSPYTTSAYLYISKMTAVGDFISNWEIASGWDMTKSTEDANVWSVTKEDVTLNVGTYELKAVANGAWEVCDIPAENYQLNITAKGIYTVTVTVNTSDKSMNVVATKTADVPIESMTVVGTFLGLEGDANWAFENGWSLKKEEAAEGHESTIWTLTKEGIELKKGDYEYKIVANNDWYDYQLPADGNATITVDEDGVYTLVITVNTESSEYTVAPNKTGETTPKYIYAIVGQGGIFDTAWDESNAEKEANASWLLTQKDGIYTWTSAKNTYLEAQTIEFKVIKKAVNVTEATKWYPEGANKTIEISEAGYYTITVTFNAETEEITSNVEQREKPIFAANSIYSWESPDGVQDQKGGTAVHNNGERVNYWTGAYYTICLNGSNDFKGDIVTITLDNALKAGDEIAITAFRNNGNAGKKSGAKLKFNDAANTTLNIGDGLAFNNISTAEAVASEYGDPNTITAKVPAAADGSTTITMTRSTTSTSLFITKIEIIRKAVDAEITSTTGWATFSSNMPVDLSSVAGLTAYTVTGVSGEKVEVSPVSGIVPANTGLLLNGEANTYSIPTAETAGADLGGNLLKPGSGEVVGAIDGYTRYVLSEADGKAVFQCIWNEKDGNDVRPTIPVGKAYLEVPVGGGARTLYINAETTGINNVEHAGQFTFGTVYNMAGQRVAQPTKGLYIMNGKKVVVK